MKYILRYLFQTAVSLEIEADSLEAAEHKAYEIETVSAALSETRLGWDEVIDGCVAVDLADGTPANVEYMDLNI